MANARFDGLGWNPLFKGSCQMIETIEQAIPAGGTVTLAHGLRSFFIESAPFPLTVKEIGKHGHALGNGALVNQGFWNSAPEHAGPVSLQIHSESEQTVRILISDGLLGSEKVDVANLNVSTERPLTNATLPDKSCLAGAQTLVYAGHADTFEVLIENLGDEVLRLGDVNTGATRGKPLNPYSEAVIKGAGAVYVWNTGAAPVDVAITLVQK